MDHTKGVAVNGDSTVLSNDLDRHEMDVLVHGLEQPDHSSAP